MKKLFLAVAMLAVASSPSAAQTWQTFNPANGGPGFWNNTSDDNVGNAVCNIGSVLTNAALTGASCSNQGPANLLPINQFASGAGGGVYYNPTSTGWALGQGTWRIDFLGQIAGAQPTTWGFWSFGSGQVFYSGSSMFLTVGAGDVGLLFLETYRPNTGSNTFYSNRAYCPGATGCSYEGPNQFALFSAANSLNGTSNRFANIGGENQLQWNEGDEYFVGMEDNATAESDSDYNDVLLRVQATVVPEPSTYLLMAAGLIPLGAYARRRRQS